ncbi:MAG: hypothetical protein AAGJ82_16205, partial [Bacteroidota bacterium]
MEILECITKNCISGLRRTGIIDDKTVLDEPAISASIDSFHALWSYQDLRKAVNRFTYNEAVEPLTYWRTFYDHSNDSILFQLKITLGYHYVGLLRLEEIELLKDNFVIYERPNLAINYDRSLGPAKGGPPPPPPPPPPPFADLIFKRSFTICPCNLNRPPVRVDYRGEVAILDEQFVYESLRKIGYKYLLAKQAGHYGIIDYDNNIILPFVHDSIKFRYESGNYWLFK